MDFLATFIGLKESAEQIKNLPMKCSRDEYKERIDRMHDIHTSVKSLINSPEISKENLRKAKRFAEELFDEIHSMLDAYHEW
jgi:CRISPR/Cas system-associated protein Cas10 (large subunit of type III CRISPR-Cas system)